MKSEQGRRKQCRIMCAAWNEAEQQINETELEAEPDESLKLKHERIGMPANGVIDGEGGGYERLIGGLRPLRAEKPGLDEELRDIGEGPDSRVRYDCAEIVEVKAALEM